jgi:hypothetical protein
MNKMMELGLFSSKSSIIVSGELKRISEGGDSITLNVSSYPSGYLRELRKGIDELSGMAFFAVRFLKAIPTISPSIPKPAEAFSIKLPCPRDFDDLIKMMSSVQTALGQNVINDKIKGHIKILSWEPGSFWFDIALGSQAAFGLAAAIVWAAAVILKKKKESELLVEKVRSLKIKNESLTDIRNAQKELLDLTVDAEARAVYDEHFGKTLDNEQMARLKHGIKLFSELINRGAEVHPSLSAPESVQNLFPDFSKLSLIESRIPKLPPAKTVSKKKKTVRKKKTSKKKS